MGNYLERVIPPWTVSDGCEETYIWLLLLLLLMRVRTLTSWRNGFGSEKCRRLIYLVTLGLRKGMVLVLALAHGVMGTLIRTILDKSNENITDSLASSCSK